MASNQQKELLSSNSKRSDDEQSVEDLLLDLEHAIKKRQDSFKPDTNIDFLDRSFEKNSPSNDDVELDEDFVLKEIEFCENEQEMRELLEIEESKLVFSNEGAYKFLYKKSLEKSFIMMKIIKGYLRKTEDSNNLKGKLNEQSRKLEGQIKENLALRKEKTELKENYDQSLKKISALREKYKEARSELKIYQGNQKSLANLDIETVLSLEQRFQDSVQKLAEYKTKVFFSYFLKIIALEFSFSRKCSRKHRRQRRS